MCIIRKGSRKFCFGDTSKYLKVIILAIVCLGILESNHAQNTPKLDSLVSVWEGENNNEAQFEELIKVAQYCREVNPKRSIHYGQLLMTHAKKYSGMKNEVKAIKEYGEALYLNRVKMDSLKINVTRGLELSKKLNYGFGEVSMLYLLGRYESRVGAMDAATDHYINVIKLCDQKNSKNYIHLAANANHGIGIIKDNQGKHKEAEVYFQNSYDIAIEYDLVELKFISLQSIGIAKALSGDMRSGLTHFLKAYNHAKRINQYSDILGNISLAYTHLGKLDSAEVYLKESIKISKEIGSSRHQTSSLSALYQWYFDKKEWGKALDVLKQREVLIQEMKSKKWIRTNYGSYADYYEAVGNYKESLKYEKLYKIANDSLLNEKNQLSITRLEKEYESVKTREELKVQAVRIDKQKNRNQLLGVIVFLLLMTLLSLYAYMKNRNRNLKALAEKEATIKKQEIEKLKKEKKLLSMRYMLEGQESERNRIAKDLHDGLGGLLSAVKAHFGMIEEEIVKLENMSIYEKAQSLMDNACDEVRRISHNLMPPLLESQGLVIAISNMVTSFESSHNIACNLDVRNMEERLSETKEIFIYRICQELLTNVRKHASASTVEISIYGLDSCVQIIVEDDGVGYQHSNIKEGLGLISIRSRVDFLNGEMEIDSEKETGTTVSIIIPNQQ